MTSKLRDYIIMTVEYFCHPTGTKKPRKATPMVKRMVRRVMLGFCVANISTYAYLARLQALKVSPVQQDIRKTKSLIQSSLLQFLFESNVILVIPFFIGLFSVLLFSSLFITNRRFLLHFDSHFTIILYEDLSPTTKQFAASLNT